MISILSVVCSTLSGVLSQTFALDTAQPCGGEKNCVGVGSYLEWQEVAKLEGTELLQHERIGDSSAKFALESSLRMYGQCVAADADIGAMGMNNIAVVYISGRPDYEKALQEAVLQYAPLGHIFHTKGKIPENFVLALEDATRTFPNASWYYLADDDSFVHLARLAQLASKYNASDYHFVGNRDCRGLECTVNLKCQSRVHKSSAHFPGWACGGPGVLLSRPLAMAAATKKCSNEYAAPCDVCFGDMVLACCLMDVWSEYHVDHEEALSPYPDDNEARVSVHHITPDTLQQLGRVCNSGTIGTLK